MTARASAGSGRRGPSAALLFLVLLVLGCGVGLRLWALLERPPGPWTDEVFAIRAARVAVSSAAWRWWEPLPLQPPSEGYVNFWVPGPYLVFYSAKS